MPLDITAADEEAARRVNRMLARAPRFKIRNRFDPLLYQSLLRVSQVGADWRIRRKGIVPSTLRVGSGTDPVGLRLLQPARPVRGVVLDIHGGGWAIGNAILNDQLNAGLIAACDVAVVSVDYRLATKAPLRGLLDDCFEAAAWLLGERELFAGLPIILVGESAGAHLAAAPLQRLRTSGHSLDRIAGALLFLLGLRSCRDGKRPQCRARHVDPRRARHAGRDADADPGYARCRAARSISVAPLRRVHRDASGPAVRRRPRSVARRHRGDGAAVGEAATAEIHARSGIAPRVHPPADADRREGAQESAWLDR